jgi:S-adenosylmethionine hydrolase
MPIMTFTTDFGHRDGYVACMHGVALGIAPDARLVDVSHAIEPQNVLHGAYVLAQVLPWFPPASVHVVVVDPGVGTARRVLAVRAAGQLIVAPDNGLLSLVHHHRWVEAVHVVENPALVLPRVSKTFHGRDVMTPVGAHLVRGFPLAQVGPATDHMEILQLAHPRHDEDGACHGTVVHRDRFGNLVSNISDQDIARVNRRRPDARVRLADRDIGPVRTTYGEVSAGQPLALVGSTGMLEIAINQGSAASQLAPPRDVAVIYG